MIKLEDLIRITPCEYIIINNADNPDDIKCIYEGYPAITDDACKEILNQYSNYEVIDQEAFYGDEDDIVGIKIDIIKTEDKNPQMILRDLLQLIDEDKEIELYDDIGSIVDSIGHSYELLDSLPEKMLLSNVIKISASCDWCDTLVIVIDIEGDFKNER